jgi:hypothetical protein
MFEDGSLAGNVTSVSKTYSTANTYHYATTTVTDNRVGERSPSIQVSCPGTTIASSTAGTVCSGSCGSGVHVTSGVAVDGTCGSAITYTFPDAATLQNTVDRCGVTGSVSSPTTFSGNGPWEWTCSGLNGGQVSPKCSTSKTGTDKDGNTVVSCPVALVAGIANSNNEVNINTNTQWTYTPSAHTGYIRNWQIVSATSTSTATTSGDILNTTFTTTGVKYVSLTKLASTTSSEILTCDSGSVASTSVVQTSSSHNEI